MSEYRWRLLTIPGCLTLWAIFTMMLPLPGLRMSIAAIVAIPLGMAALSWGVALLVLLAGSLFLAGRRAANPAVQPVGRFLSGLGEEARHRWENRGVRHPRVRGFVRQVAKAGGEIFYHLSLALGFSACLNIMTVGAFKALLS